MAYVQVCRCVACVTVWPMLLRGLCYHNIMAYVTVVSATIWLCYRMTIWPMLLQDLCYSMASAYHTACVTTGWPVLPYGQHYCVAITDTFVHTTRYICHTVLTYSIYSIWGVDGWPIYHSLLCRYPSSSIHISLKAANICWQVYLHGLLVEA